MESLLLLERIIIESLSKKEKNIYELVSDTSLDQGLLLNLLPELLMKNLIRYHRGIYSIDREQSFLWSESINKKEFLKEEVRELFASMVNEYFKKDLAAQKATSDLKVQKIWLTNDEELILKSHLVSLENFFKNVREKRLSNPLKEKTYEQKVVVWGVSNYAELLSGVLEAV